MSSDFSNLSIPELHTVLEKKTKAALLRQIETIDQTVANFMREQAHQLIAASLGFSMRFNTLEVDTCNGRKTELANAIGEMAFTQLQLAFPDFIADYIDNAKARGYVDAGMGEYQRVLYRKVNDHVDKWIDQEALRRSREIISALTPVKKDG